MFLKYLTFVFTPSGDLEELLCRVTYQVPAFRFNFVHLPEIDDAPVKAADHILLRHMMPASPRTFFDPGNAEPG